MKKTEEIIDGIDVLNCKFFQEDYTDIYCRLTEDSCSASPNCYYKQLKRKEQECEELKATLKVIANKPCLNINDCDGNCLPHCKWNAHKLAQEALKELE